MKPLTPAYAAVILLVGLGSAFPALATSTRLKVLGTSPNASDVFKFNCPSGTVRAEATVEDINPPFNPKAHIRARLISSNLNSDLTEDTKPPSTFGEGSASRPSPSEPAVLRKGPGDYLLAVYKTAAGPEVYRASVVCKTSSGTKHPKLRQTQDR